MPKTLRTSSLPGMKKPKSFESGMILQWKVGCVFLKVRINAILMETRQVQKFKDNYLS